MTDEQAQLLEVSKEYEVLKAKMKELKPKLTELLEKVGIGNHFQEPSKLTVYQVVKPKGKYTYFDTIDYERTKFADEKKGSLSMKKAEELGYSLK